jgi:hypothetical protein
MRLRFVHLYCLYKGLRVRANNYFMEQNGMRVVTVTIGHKSETLDFSDI